MRYRYLFISAVLCAGLPAFGQPGVNQQLNILPSRVLGHPNPEQLNVVTAAPNLVNGVEMWRPEGIALDTSANPPIVYVADTLNNRVLAWKNATSFSNGARADLVIGQNDMFSTLPQGPGSNPPTPAGLAFPTGMTVDSKGSLYVVDSGNNRVLRYPAPFSQKQALLTPDLVIGQPNLNSNQSNYYANGSSPINGQCVSTLAGNSPLTAGLAFDSAGNLWFTDAGNVRVLRYPAANIPSPNVGNTVGGISADLVLGQPSLTSQNTTPLSQLTSPMLVKNQFGNASGVGFDPAGNLYVVDTYGDNVMAEGRVLVFPNPNSLPSGNGSASRILGVITGTAEYTALNITTSSAALLFQFQSYVAQPNAIFFLPDGSIGVVDTGFNRLLIFPPYSQWPAESTQYSPKASGVVGQNNVFTNFFPNAAQNKTLTQAGATPPAAGNSLWGPGAATFLPSTNELFVADTQNNRVVVLPVGSGDSFGSASRVLGQANAIENSPNYIEGREFWFQNGGFGEAGIAIDGSGSVPHLYVSDPFNNRVLGFYDARKVKANAKADIVIGQPDFNTGLCNYNKSTQTGGDPTAPSQTSLCVPAGVIVDGSGNLYVADSVNGRVMRFPSPFANYPNNTAALEAADMVLGQQGFSAQLRQASQFNMVAPYGLAVTGKNGLLVSDTSLNRVTYYPFTNNGTFNPQSDSGSLQPTKVFGQTDFVSKLQGSGNSNLNQPLGISTDGFGRLYVADAGNNRISIFPDPNTATNNGTAAKLTIPNVGQPESVFVNPATDEIWIANTTQNNCLRFAKYDSLFLGATPETTIPTVSAPVAIATDPNGALYVADATNRIAIYYPTMQAINAANLVPDFPLAPGMWASLCSPGSNCNGGTAVFSSTTFSPQMLLFSQVPIPTVLGDVQVSVNGTFAVMEYVSPTQLNFLVPSNAPTSGFAYLEVTQASTGQVLAAGLVQMNVASPGVFMTQYTGTTRQAAVLNEDGSANTQTTPAQRGHVIQIFATGQGVYSGWPADGVPAGSNNLVPAGLTSAIVGSCLVNDTSTVIEGCGSAPGDPGNGGPHSWIPFTGLAPGEVGVWQVNVQVPMAIPPPTGGAPSVAAPVLLLLNGGASNDSKPAFNTVVYVK